METMNQNSLLGDTFLNSKYFNPEYLFNAGGTFIKQFILLVFSEEGKRVESTILFFFAVFFLSIISYTIVRLLEIRKKEHAHLHHEIEEYAHNKAEYEKRLREEVGGSKNVQWSTTLNYLFSQHASNWKLAIIEADAMLDALLDQLGFKGENLGDKLKSADQERFPLLSTAWEVHTVRNRIAHEGLAFELSHHEAKRVIALYEKIFHSYGFI
jgi:hypothetical protein